MTPCEIIPLWGARSSRNQGAASFRYEGRHHPGIGGRLPQESAAMTSSDPNRPNAHPDGPAAWAIARAAYDDWQAKCEAEGKRPSRIAEGTLAATFSEYRQTQEWAGKAVRTREEWNRCWALIGPALGPCRPPTVPLAQISTFRRMVEANVSLREAHRCIKIWRALWRVAAALKYCQRDADPSLGVPSSRSPDRPFGSTARSCGFARGAWRAGYKGLAALMAVAWEHEPLVSRRALLEARRPPRVHVRRRAGPRHRPSSHWNAQPGFLVGARRLFVRARRRCRVDGSDLPQSIRPRLFEGHARRRFSRCARVRLWAQRAPHAHRFPPISDRRGNLRRCRSRADHSQNGEPVRQVRIPQESRNGQQS
jgi:hypothetical protein